MMDQLQGSEVKQDGPHAKPLTLMSSQLREQVSGRQGGVGVPCSLAWQRCGQRATSSPEDESPPLLAYDHVPLGKSPSLVQIFRRTRLQ